MYRYTQKIPYRLIAICLLCGFLLVSCQNQTMTSSEASYGMRTIVLHNPTSDQLNVYFNLSVGGYTSTDQDTTTIELSIINQDHLVQFAGDEHLICNGKAIPLHKLPLPLVIQAPTRMLEGKVITCTYSAKGTSTTSMFIVPHTAFISSPQNKTLLPRSSHTLVTYSRGEGEIAGLVALGTNTKALAQLDTPGFNQATIDTSAMKVGEGTIILTQNLKIAVNQTGKPFKTVSVTGTTTATISVIWT